MRLRNERGTARQAVVAAGGAALLLLLALASAAAPSRKKNAAGQTAPLPKLHYNRDIRPILAENCFACHGPDSAARKAELRLDKLTEATKPRNGHVVIAPGKPAGSEIIRRISLTKGPLAMPPVAGHKRLTPDQVAMLTRWISEGAAYEPHWSYLPPKRTALPIVENAAWCKNPIDRFILAKLEQNGLNPAPQADRRTLARRLSLDLIGLPPEPDDVERFVRDPAPDAYDKLVDFYMSKPQWGEHRARYWLDAARYADTHGIHFDNYREIWSYRDWVIAAFNQNKPFDQFTMEQLAGDLLPNPTLEQRIATGFNRCNITTNEGGAINEEYNVLYARDRTETVAQTWLGATAGCAVCHDHKFDPISQKEFYSLSAYFNNTTQAAMDGNVQNTAPIIAVPLPEDRDRFALLKGEKALAQKQTDDRRAAARPDFAKWLGVADAQTFAAQIPADGLRFRLPLNEEIGRKFAATVDGKAIELTATAEPGRDAGVVSNRAFQRKMGATLEIPQAGDFDSNQPFTASAWVKLPQNASGGSVMARMDDQHDYRGWDIWVEGGRIGMHVINKWPENALKVVAQSALTPDKWHHVCAVYPGTRKPGKIKIFIDGQSRPLDIAMDTLKDTCRTTVPLKIGQRHSTSGLDNVSVSEVRLYDRALSETEAANLAKNTRSAWLVSRGAAITSGERDELYDGWLTAQDADYRQSSAKLAALQSEESAILGRGTIAHVSQERDEAAMAYVLFRGAYDQRRDKVIPGTPAALPPMPADFPRNRLGFAKWLLLPENPLPARVTVNRFWQEIFGSGIVRTTGDFGITGELPSHPELLDYLAISFRENGWDVKKFFKLLVTSATYKQSALVTPQKRFKDPLDKLLSRAPRFRMDAEMVRDYALSASGLLVRKIGGPSVRPYQPDGVWEAVAISGSDTRFYKQDSGENLYRRSLYTFWKRSAPPASLEIFNAPSREACTVRRERTDTPLQALVTLNDPQYVEAARTLAQKALLEGGATDAARFDFLANRLLARPFAPAEQAIVAATLRDLLADYAALASLDDAKKLIAVGESKPDATIPPQKLAAWTMLVNQLMNLDEALNK